MKFDFSKSTSADLSNKITISKLDILMKNVLYLTHQVDYIRKRVNELVIDKGLQKQVDEYFAEDDETSPQTEHGQNDSCLDK